jgi:23S rRNA pseudouridine2605 synthase
MDEATSGEGRNSLDEADSKARKEAGAFQKKTRAAASDAPLEAGPGMEAAHAAVEEQARPEAAGPSREEAVMDRDEDGEAASAAGLREPAKLERLQKILSQAGVASRRSAEEMIAAGRVMVNGQVVTTLGSKADPARDHIRVDGKLLHGAERHRYFMLNKPRGYVTTMSDPEGRPTVMEFFAKARERVYPVGRLDYLSEGLLLMTNDGELANLLTKAGSGVEKTYLVKVAGQPNSEEIERLRAGVAIEKGAPGSERVRTAPARIRQFREGDNPWFEVVLIEGRNRELRKMFAAIGHFAEKIRRVGYGPLVLDLEPGKMRELDEDEVSALRLTAEGKMKPRRNKATRMLPREAGVPAEQRAEQRGGRGGKEFGRRGDQASRPQGRQEFRGQKPFVQEKPRFEERKRGPFQPRGERSELRGGPKREWQPRSEGFRGAPKARPEFRPAAKREGGENRFGGTQRPPFKPRGERPEFRSSPRQDRGENRFGGAQRGAFKPREDRPAFRAAPRREGGEKTFGSTPRPPFKPRGERPAFRSAPRQERGENRFGEAKRGPFKPSGDRPQWKPRGEFKPRFEGARGSGSGGSGKFGGDRPKPAFGGKPGGQGKFRGQGGGAKRGFSRPGAPRGGGKRG